MNNQLNVKIKKLSKKAVIPSYATNGSAGMDLVAISKTETNKYIEYDTGIAVAIPEGYVGFLFPRSSVSKYDLDLCNAVGCVDSDYRASIKLRFNKIATRDNFILNTDYCHQLFNFIHSLCDVRLSFEDIKEYQVGDKVAQLIIMPYPKVSFEEVDELDETIRGEGGFGSTDAPKENIATPVVEKIDKNEKKTIKTRKPRKKKE